MKRIISLVLTIFMLATLLTGCTGDGKVLYDALFEKQHLQSKTAMTLGYKVSCEGFDEMNFPTFLNNFGIKMDYELMQKMSEDYKKVELSGKTMSTIGMEDLGFFMGMDIWIDMDLTNPENPKFVETIRYPELLRSNMYYFANKKFEYIQLDLFEMLKQANGTDYFDLAQFMSMVDMKQQKEIIQKALANISVPIKSRTIEGTKKEFTVKLSDKETMKLFNESLKALVTSEYFDLMTKPMTDLNLFTKEEAMAQIDRFFLELAKINYIGKEGSEFVFVVNRDGYLEKSDTTINFRFSLKELVSLVNAFLAEDDKADLEDVPKGIINLQVTSNSIISELPKDTQIQFPVTNEENTLDYVKMLTDMEERYSNNYYYDNYDPLAGIDQAREGLTLYQYGYPIEMPAPGILDYEGVLMVPVRVTAEDAFDYTVIYDEESQNIWIKNYINTIKIKVGSNIAYINGEAKEYPYTAQFIGENVYVPLDLLTDHCFYSVEWHQTDGGWAGVIDWRY